VLFGLFLLAIVL